MWMSLDNVLLAFILLFLRRSLGCDSIGDFAGILATDYFSTFGKKDNNVVSHTLHRREYVSLPSNVFLFSHLKRSLGCDSIGDFAGILATDYFSTFGKKDNNVVSHTLHRREYVSLSSNVFLFSHLKRSLGCDSIGDFAGILATDYFSTFGMKDDNVCSNAFFVTPLNRHQFSFRRFSQKRENLDARLKIDANMLAQVADDTEGLPEPLFHPNRYPLNIPHYLRVFFRPVPFEGSLPP
ncbi:hypothetical protein CDAR_461601 [Caerostris darwini]|uniref:Uncharacterized protein n=1 Tax=Caerostris darwini TaxID=1538125 RepID=A0AAV4M5Q1_9ARAC|nr:hypothetical protein CDAR_461601 [Caerostris darwini]